MLGGRNEPTIDALRDAMQMLGQERQGRELMDRMANHADKSLVTAARSRLVRVLATRVRHAGMGDLAQTMMQMANES